MALLLLLLQDPVIVEARALSGGAGRAGCWLPVEVTVESAAAFEGDVAVVADRITVAQAIRLAPGEKRTTVVPALPRTEGPVDVELHVRGEVRARQRLGGFRLARADERIVVKRAWGDVDPALFEAMDEIEGEPWTPPARFGVVEPGIAPLVPREAWIGAKRDAAILFIVVYGFAAFVVLFAGMRRRFGTFTMVVLLVGFSAVFAAGFFALFPRGSTAVRAYGAVAEGREYRLHFVRGGLVTFARPAKPVFASEGEIGDVEVRIDRGWSVRGAYAMMTVTDGVRLEPGGADGGVEVKFFASRLRGQAFREDRAPALSGVSAKGLIEARLERRLSFR